MAEWKNGANGYVGPNAVIAGNDINNETLYVGRVNCEGDLIPGKIVPSHGRCYVSYAGNEIGFEDYEYLVKPNYGSFAWVNSYLGEIPSGAIIGGNTSCGEALFVGRSYHQGSLVPGKVHPSHKCCYVPFGGQEIGLTSYEVLTIKYD